MVLLTTGSSSTFPYAGCIPSTHRDGDKAQTGAAHRASKAEQQQRVSPLELQQAVCCSRAVCFGVRHPWVRHPWRRVTDAVPNANTLSLTASRICRRYTALDCGAAAFGATPASGGLAKRSLGVRASDHRACCLRPLGDSAPWPARSHLPTLRQTADRPSCCLLFALLSRVRVHSCAHSPASFCSTFARRGYHARAPDSVDERTGLIATTSASARS